MAYTSKRKELTLDYLTGAVPKKYKKYISQETVDNVNGLSGDPDYGQEFLDTFVTHTNLLDGTEKWSMDNYLDAVKFTSLSFMGMSQVEAYIKTFPYRYESRVSRGQGKTEMTGEASRFNSTSLVNKIRQQALVPLHLVNQGTTQLAINTLTKLMLTARSEVAKVSAATALLKELRPPEAQQVELQIGLSDEVTEMHKKQTDSLLQIAENQRKMLEAGHSIEDVQRINATIVEADIDE